MSVSSYIMCHVVFSIGFLSLGVYEKGKSLRKVSVLRLTIFVMLEDEGGKPGKCRLTRDG